MAILLLLHEPPKDEPAQQHDVANGFSNRSDGRPVRGVPKLNLIVVESRIYSLRVRLISVEEDLGNQLGCLKPESMECLALRV